MKDSFYFIQCEFFSDFHNPWVSISLTERNNCSFPAGLNEFFLNSGPKGVNIKFGTFFLFVDHSSAVLNF